MNSTINNLEEFKSKYGETGYSFIFLIEEFIKRSPEFKGDTELAKEIGIAIADLQIALSNS